jgi:4-aminobutyrate aminotransferase-like enzyme
VVDALCRQARVLNTNTRYVFEAVVEYAERLISTVSPGFACIFTCTGSEANDLAWRLARTVTGNNGAVTTENGYHGNTTFLDSIDGSSAKIGRERAEWWTTVPAPKRSGIQSEDEGRRLASEYAERYEVAVETLRRNGYKPAAFFFDPYFCTDGVCLPPRGFIDDAVERLKKAGALIVADEVQAGLGRSGSHMWAFQRLGANPDIVVMGKPMGNGHPIGVVVARKEIVDAFYASDRYFNTFAGNPVSCAVGLAVLDVLDDEHLQENARKMGDRIRMGLEELARRFSIIGEIRGKGLLLGVEIVETKGDKQIPAGRHARWIINEMCRQGVLVGLTGANRNERNVLKIRPPMVFDESGVELLLSTLNAVLARVPTDFRE